MKFEISINPTTLINEVMGNYPEYSLSLTCVDFDYKECKFQFWDHEVTPASKNESIIPAKIENLKLRLSGIVKDAVTYELTQPILEKGLSILVEKILAGELAGLGLDSSNITDACQWDADCADALVQCAIFGDVIYG